MKPEELFEGGCQCGAVRFQAKGAPKFVGNCHCASCRKATGAAFSTWVGFEEQQVAWTTSPPQYFSSSPDVERGLCSICGSSLTYAGAKWPGELHLVIGAFDGPHTFTPSGAVFTDEALAWAVKDA